MLRKLINRLLQYLGYIAQSDEINRATFPINDFDKSSIKLESTLIKNKQYNVSVDRLYFWEKYTILSIIFEGLDDGAYYSNYKYEIALIDTNGINHKCLYVYLLTYNEIRKICDSSDLCSLRLLEKEHKVILLFFSIIPKELLITGRIHFKENVNIDFKISK